MAKTINVVDDTPTEEQWLKLPPLPEKQVVFHLTVNEGFKNPGDPIINIRRVTVGEYCAIMGCEVGPGGWPTDMSFFDMILTLRDFNEPAANAVCDEVFGKEE